MIKYEVKEIEFEYHFKNGKITAVSGNDLVADLIEREGKVLKEFDNEAEALKVFGTYEPSIKLAHYAISFLVGTAYVVEEVEYDEDGELMSCETIDYKVKAYNPNEEE